MENGKVKFEMLNEGDVRIDKVITSEKYVFIDRGECLYQDAFKESPNVEVVEIYDNEDNYFLFSERCFAGLRRLKYVFIPSIIKGSVQENIFDGCDDVVVYTSMKKPFFGFPDRWKDFTIGITDGKKKKVVSKVYWGSSREEFHKVIKEYLAIDEE